MTTISIPALGETHDAMTFLADISTRGAQIQTALYALMRRDDLPADVLRAICDAHSDLGTIVYDTMTAELAPSTDDPIDCPACNGLGADPVTGADCGPCHGGGTVEG